MLGDFSPFRSVALVLPLDPNSFLGHAQLCGQAWATPGSPGPRSLSLALVLSCYASQNVFSKSEIKFSGRLHALGSGQGPPVPTLTGKKP